MRSFETIIQVKELASLLKGPAKVHLIEAGMNSRQEYTKYHIPSARYFDLLANSYPDEYSIPSLQTSEAFNKAMKSFGIPNDSSQVVCYDRGGLLLSSRLWWQFKAFNRKSVAVLDGGLMQWLLENYDVVPGEEVGEEVEIGEPYTINRDVYKSLKEVGVIASLIGQNPPQSLTQILDLRAPSDFIGHSNTQISNIKGSKNLHFKRLLTEQWSLKPPAELAEEFKSVGINLSNDYHVINTCYAGISACVAMLAQQHIGKTNCSVYDGSWNEFSQFLQKLDSKQH
mmetsp:Transcript_6525/g.11422  ORF Transcript_6525/g.11422 Transcript_6525/m.11422 type:complete len:284 (+) Transcript_6525:2842-3693(+)